MSQQDKLFYIKEFRSEECQCGKNKKSRMAFCYNCYTLLPKEKQNALYQSFGQGYEEAYDDALIYLMEV